MFLTIFVCGWYGFADDLITFFHGGTQTQTKMEEWTIGNVRAAIEKGRVNSIVPEQEDMQ